MNTQTQANSEALRFVAAKHDAAIRRLAIRLDDSSKRERNSVRWNPPTWVILSIFGATCYISGILSAVTMMLRGQ
jgi:hypothetical protein